jgi:antitoxin component of RelBE/YafQ-DinJ toxin-antitoxin module
MASSVINLRIPDDLRAALYQAAETHGVTVSEWIRGLIHQAAYNERLGVDDGYAQGKAIGYMIATRIIARGMKDLAGNIPATVAEADAWLHTNNFGNSSHSDG